MPRFGDQWVVDRTMFEFVAGGSCACCGMMHFMPGGTEGMIKAMSDLETDAANAEINALEFSPWPADMRDQVWADRLRLRHKMKLEMKDYAKFWDEHSEGFVEWMKSRPPKYIKRLLQIPRTEIMECVGSKYNIHSAFAIVMCAVCEQVANFDKTQLPPDGRGEIELQFEEALYYDKRGGFTMDVTKEETIMILCNRIKSMGGPKLLDRNPKKKMADDNDEEEDDEDVDGADNKDDKNDPEENGTVRFDKNGKPVASFRLDRRVIRLFIARFLADGFQKRYLKHLEEQKKDAGES